jgi:glycolate oxidase iron-sulfur subunit
MLTDYGHLLGHDPEYAERARRMSGLSRDISQVIAAESVALQEALSQTGGMTRDAPVKVAFHSPCSLQHGLKVRGVVESVLAAAGFELTPVPDGHLCCGSAGTYSILQPELSTRLLKGKVAALEQGAPAVIATANIGCLTHLRSGTSRPVRHWIELLRERLDL